MLQLDVKQGYAIVGIVLSAMHRRLLEKAENSAWKDSTCAAGKSTGVTPMNTRRDMLGDERNRYFCCSTALQFATPVARGE